MSLSCTRFAVPIVLVLVQVATAVGCPFCVALKPSLAQQRASASAVALGEMLAPRQADAAAPLRFRVHQWLKANDSVSARSIDVPSDRASGCRSGKLALLFLTTGGESPAWQAIPASEALAVYLARAPEVSPPSPKRLEYFLPHLEHADPAVAEDAFLEFGLAPYSDVASLAARFDAAALRSWLSSSDVAPERKGFYGLALGLTATAQPAEREANVALLREQLIAQANDFRAGFDGILAGSLVAEGPVALEFIAERFLRDPAALEGDVRHALSAVRFAREFVVTIETKRIDSAVGSLLKRPEFAAEAVVDLARWQSWDALPEVTKLYRAGDPNAVPTNRAVVGYLSACPLPTAEEALAELRRGDPQGVERAESVLQHLGRTAE